MKKYEIDGGITIVENPDMDRPEYPVGEHMQRNMKHIKMLCETIKAIVPSGKNVNIWCSGSSGAIIGALVSLKLYKKSAMVCICHVKKDGENHHGGTRCTPLTGNTYDIIVDDFVAMGDTVMRILRQSGNVDCLAICGGMYKSRLSLFTKSNIIDTVICRSYDD